MFDSPFILLIRENIEYYMFSVVYCSFPSCLLSCLLRVCAYDHIDLMPCVTFGGDGPILPHRPMGRPGFQIHIFYVRGQIICRPSASPPAVGPMGPIGPKNICLDRIPGPSQIHFDLRIIANLHVNRAQLYNINIKSTWSVRKFLMDCKLC